MIPATSGCTNGASTKWKKHRPLKWVSILRPILDIITNLSWTSTSNEEASKGTSAQWASITGDASIKYPIFDVSCTSTSNPDPSSVTPQTLPHRWSGAYGWSKKTLLARKMPSRLFYPPLTRKRVPFQKSVTSVQWASVISATSKCTIDVSTKWKSPRPIKWVSILHPILDKNNQFV